MKKVNLGCGTTCLKDWINIDSSYNARLAKYPQLRYLLYKIGILPEKSYNIPWKNCIDYVIIRDLKRSLPFHDNSIDFIYTSHFLEHLSKYEADNLLRECYRSLKVGGIIRIAVPDLKLFVEKYVKEVSKDNYSEDYIPADAFLENILIVDRKRPSLLRIALHQYDIHRWMYDADSLKNTLRNSGFVEIEKRKFHEGRVPDIEFLDNRPEESLYMEATK